MLETEVFGRLWYQLITAVRRERQGGKIKFRSFTGGWSSVLTIHQKQVPLNVLHSFSPSELEKQRREF